jgi:hypothetical protein
MSNKHIDQSGPVNSQGPNVSIGNAFNGQPGNRKLLMDDQKIPTQRDPGKTMDDHKPKVIFWIILGNFRT